MTPRFKWNPGLGRWVLYYVGLDGELRRSIGRALGEGRGFESGVPLLRGSDLDAEELDGPSVLEETERETKLIVRRRRGAESDLVLVALTATPTQAADQDAGPGGARAYRVASRQVILRPGANAADFDFAGIGTADLLVGSLERTHLLYFNGFSTVTSSLGIQASDDLLHWTPKRLAFGSSEPGAGFLDPDVLEHDGRIWVFFARGDERSSAIEWIRRPVSLP